MNKKISALFGLACAAAIGTLSGTSHASQLGTCTVQYVQYADSLLAIKCAENPNELFAWGTAWSACPFGQNIDNLKAYQNIAISAYMSGKKLLINYDNSQPALCQYAISLVRVHD